MLPARASHACAPVPHNPHYPQLGSELVLERSWYEQHEGDYGASAASTAIGKLARADERSSSVRSCALALEILSPVKIFRNDPAADIGTSTLVSRQTLSPKGSRNSPPNSRAQSRGTTITTCNSPSFLANANTCLRFVPLLSSGM